MDFPLDKLLSAAKAGGNWRFEFRANGLDKFVASEVVREISADRNRDYLDRFFLRIRNAFRYSYYLLCLCSVSLMTMLVLYSAVPHVGNLDFILRLVIFALIAVIAHFALRMHFKISLQRLGKGNDVTCDVDFSSLTYDGGGRKIAIQWQEVAEIRESEDYLMIFGCSEAEIALPKRIFGGEKKLLKFKMFCLQALENAQSEYTE